MSTDRELQAIVDIAASADKVWETLTDFDNLVQASPELVAMRPMKSGGLRNGQWYLGVNRRGWVWWPTRNVIVAVEPGKTLAWDTTTSGARWIFELTTHGGGTRLVQRRPVPRRLTASGRAFAATLLGGGESHAAELETAMIRTLQTLKRIAEAGG